MHDFEPRLLRAFVAVAEELHFGRAAKRLHISQPPLSMQIRRLELQLEARLFERDRRHVRLTEAGWFMLDRARHLLAETERARLEVRRIAHGESGVLAVGYTPTAMYELLPKLIPAFAKLRPDVRLELIEMRSALQPDALREHRIEVGFACGPLSQPDLHERVLVRERLIAALPASHPLARRSKLSVSALAGQPIVLVRRDVEPLWADASRAAIEGAGHALQVVQEADTKLALLGLVAASVGLSPVSSSMRHLGRRGVTFRDLTGLSLKLPLVSLAREQPSARAAELLQLAARTRV
jgi:DNA-binding transcriptional LysR family regulator